MCARHDSVKMTINSLILDSGIRADCEVFGLFRDIIPVEALNKEEGLRFGRGRQGLLPDYRLDLPGQGGGPGALGQVESKLAELKVIGAVETYYPRAGARARNKKGVEKRAGLIPGEYKRPLAALDTRYHRVEEGQTGPLVRRLERFGNILTWWWAPGKRRARICMACLTSLQTTWWQCLAWPEVERQRTCQNSVGIPPHSVNNGGKSKFSLY